MIDRWLAEGDRLSEAGQAAQIPASTYPPRRLPRLVIDVGAQANRHRVAVMSGVGLLGLLAVIGAYREPAAAGNADSPTGAASSPIAASVRAVAPATPPAEPIPAPTPPPSAGAATGPADPGEPLPASPVERAAAPEPAPKTSRPGTTLRIEAAPAVIEAARPAFVRASSEASPESESLHPVVKAKAPVAAPPPLEACKTALKRERTREALSACRFAADRAPDSPETLVLLAHADLLAGRSGETLRLAQRASELDPSCAEAYLLIGNVQQSAGNKPHARRAYEAYLQLAPHGDHAAEVRAVLGTF